MLKRITPVLILLPILIIFFFDVIFLGKTISTSSLLPGTCLNGPCGYAGYKPAYPFSIDIGGHAWTNEPNPYILRDIIKRGSLPLWNPREGLGMPLLANPNTEVFNPVKSLLNLHPTPFLQDLFFLLRLLFMGLFTYLFLREMKLSPVSSLFGSTFFMLSGYSAWWINLHPLSSIMYIPAFFYFMERWRNRDDRFSPFFLVLSIALSVFSGKMPDVIMGLTLLMLYGVLRGFEQGRLRGLIKWSVRSLAVSLTGIMLASIVVIPFLELHSTASPLAKALRTGASGHRLPLITSISLWQPFFLGGENYLYNSWLQHEPDILLPYAGLTVLLLFLYSFTDRRLIKESLPFIIFSTLLFFQIYGFLPSTIFEKVPLFRSMNFLKYNSMLYFSFSVVSAVSLHSITSYGTKGRGLASILFVTIGLMYLYYYSLKIRAGEGVRPNLDGVLLFSIIGILVFGISCYLLRKRPIIRSIFVLLMMLSELYLYMPKDHPDRDFPYKEPPYTKVIKEEDPFRIIGNGESIPPLVSNVLGLYDIRGMNVLIPGDYYIFFEHLIGFSIPYTNAPDPLVSATSPWADLLGIKYILSSKPLETDRLEDALNFHVRSLRWIRLFDAMVRHSVEGWATYGFSEIGGEERFSLRFPADFKFKIRLRVTEPFIFAGFAVKGSKKDGGVGVVIKIDDNRVAELVIKGDKGWNDQWIDVSPYIGRVINLTIEGDGSYGEKVLLGNFGLSPGSEEENTLYENLLRLHKRELPFLEYMGEYEGFHIYKNSNVMKRAFVLHKARQVNSLSEVIKELQRGFNFREVGLVSGKSGEAGQHHLQYGLTEGERDVFKEESPREEVIIKKYAPDEIVINLESKGGILVLSDLYYPGWKVKVNGKKGELMRVFGLLRGVSVDEGRSEVVFYYSPFSLYAGALISLTVFILCVWYLYHTKGRDHDA